MTEGEETVEGGALCRPSNSMNRRKQTLVKRLAAYQMACLMLTGIKSDMAFENLLTHTVIRDPYMFRPGMMCKVKR